MNIFQRLKDKLQEFSVFRGFFAIAQRFGKSQGARLSASIGYYAVFGLVPLIYLLSLVFQRVSGQFIDANVVDLVTLFAGSEIASSLQQLASDQGLGGSVFSIVLSLVVMFFASGKLVSELQFGLNHIFGHLPRTVGWFRSLMNKAIDLAVVVFGGIVLLFFAFLQTVLQTFAERINEIYPSADLAVQGMSMITTFVVGTLVFTALFRILPYRRLRTSSLWAGGLLVSLLSMAGQFAIGWYIATFGIVGAYGAAGTLVAVLLWVYYSAVILLFGAAVTWYLDSASQNVELAEEQSVI